MDIQKEKIAHEKHLLSQGVDFKYLPNIQYNELENIYELIEWDEEYSEALNEINSSWCTWQAAKAQAVQEWISVKNAMPKAGSWFVAYDDYNGFVETGKAEGGFSVFGGKADRVEDIIYTLMYLANYNKYKLLDCLDDYLNFSAELAEKPIDVFKHQKPYALIELSEADSETHVILSDEHYEFKDVHFYDAADLAVDRSEALEMNGVKTILLNTHALMAEFYKHEASCLAAQIGIDSVNYDVKQ